MISLKMWHNLKQWRYNHHDSVDVDPEVAEKLLFEEGESISTEHQDQRACRLDRLRLLTIVNVVILGVTVFLNSLPYLNALKPHGKNAAIKAVASYC